MFARRSLFLLLVLGTLVPVAWVMVDMSRANEPNPIVEAILLLTLLLLVPIVMSFWKIVSIALAIDLFRPAANTVTKTTSARPIISAAEVTAVRPGLRIAFSRASRPVSPRSRSSGQPAIAASGRTRRGLNSDAANRNMPLFQKYSPDAT